jgi:filamentous hemagglutinin
VSAALTLGEGALLAAGMTGENGSLQGDGALSLVAEALLASDAGLAAAGNAEISADRIQLDQSETQAALTVLGAASLTSNEISASNAQLTVGGDLALNTTGDLTLTDGEYRSGGDLSVAAESLTSSADFTVSGRAEVETRSGPMTLTGDLKAEGQVALSAAGNLGLSGRLASGDTISLSATGALTSSGTVVAERDLSISAASITNSGAVGSSAANLSLQSPGDILNSGLFYAGQDITLALDGTLENRSADIIAEGGIHIQGLSDTRAAAVQNRLANIEAITGSLIIAAAHLANEQPMPTILTEVVSVTSRSGSPGDFPGVSHPSRTYSVTETTTTTRQVIDETTNNSARMRAGGDVQINADSIVNQYSQIAANGDVTLTANSITNSGQDLVETVTVHTVSHYEREYCKKKFLWFCSNTEQSTSPTATRGSIRRR